LRSSLISLAFFLAAAGSAVAASGSNNAGSFNNIGSNIGNGVGNGVGNGAGSSVGNGLQNGEGNGNLTVSGPPTATGTSGGATLGWNYFHAFYCLSLIDGSDNQWTYVFSKETPSKFFFTENISYWADAFRSACPTGSLVGIHVTNSTNGTFDQVAVYGPGF
jgi:hypothetical protein